MFKHITRTVWLLSLVSLLNDASSEMLYPIIPLFLQQIGYSTILIGVLEGIAEFISGLSKMYMGSLSDSFNRRLPFVNIGYSLSVLSRPMIGFTKSTGLIFVARSIDKIGKGIRTSARDALLADESNKNNRAEVFGFHRAMDTVGAIVGPLTAMVYLHYYPQDYKTIFLITIIPGFLAVLATFLIKEKKLVIDQEVSLSFKNHFSFYKKAPKVFLQMVGILVLFGLVNSSDMFLLLRAKQVGIKENNVLLLYLLFNVVYALAAFPMGKIADKFGRINILLLGLLLYAISYILFAKHENVIFIYSAFILYGLYYACTQSTIKTLLLQTVDKTQRASAIGFYEGLNSFSLMIANMVAGFVWHQLGAEYMLLYTATIVMIVLSLLILLHRKMRFT